MTLPDPPKGPHGAGPAGPADGDKDRAPPGEPLSRRDAAPDGEDAAGRAGDAAPGRLAEPEPVARKVYYSIGEVGELTGLKAHVLRYWESQFAAVSPGKNRGGSRVYRVEDIRTIFLVKRLLYEERFTIEGAKQRLDEMRRAGAIKREAGLRAEPALLALIKDGLAAAREALTLPPDQATPPPPD